MIPVKLSADGIYDTKSAIFSFDKIEVYAINYIETIKQCLNTAIFGNDAFTKGYVELEYLDKGATYIATRDFKDNTVVVDTIVNGEKKKIAEGTDADKLLKDTIGLTQQQFIDYIIASKHDAYDSSCKDIKEYIERVLDGLKINKELVDSSKDVYAKESEIVKNKLQVLDEFNGNYEGLEEKKEELEKEIAGIKEDLDKLTEGISFVKVGEGAKEDLAKVQEKYDREEATSAKREDDAKRITRSRAIKEHYAKVDTLVKLDTEIKQLGNEISEKETAISNLKAEVKDGQESLKQKETAFIDASAKAKEINQAFDEMIQKNAETGESEQHIIDSVDKLCEDEVKDIGSIKKEFTATAKKKSEIDKAIAKLDSEYKSIHLSADYRLAVREGAAFESLIQAKKEQTLDLEKSIEVDQAKLSELREQLFKSEAILQQCQVGYKKIFGEETKENKPDTYQALIADFNELERIKQNIYRNQIISASLIQDIDAIDKKIGENNETCAVSDENLEALEDAKTTLVKYIEKLQKRIDEEIDVLTDINGQLRFFEDIESLEYGSKCPVCSGIVTSKPKVDSVTNSYITQKAEIEEKYKHDKEIYNEYLEKLEKINLKIGSLKAQVLASQGYVKSLEATKKIKLAALNKLYKENHVASHDELTNDLERVIEEISKYSAMISDVKAIVEKESIAKDEYETLSKEIAQLEENSIPEKQQQLAELYETIDNMEREYKKTFAEKLEGEQAISKLNAIIGVEKREDEIYYELTNYNNLKAETDKKYEELLYVLKIKEGRLFKINKDGKEYDYSRLCVNYANQMYVEIINDIRNAEDARQAAQDEYIALAKTVKEKEDALQQLENELEVLKKKQAVDNDYVATLTNAESEEAKLLEGIDYEKVKGEILDDSAEQVLLNEIANHDKLMVTYKTQIDTLTAMVNGLPSDSSNPKDDAAKNQLEQKLQNKEDEYVDIMHKIYMAKVLDDKINKYRICESNLAKNFNDSAIISSEEGIEELVVNKANNILSNLLPQHRFKIKEKGIILLASDNGLERELPQLEDTEYVIASVALIYAINNIISVAINNPSISRIVRIKSNMVAQEMKQKLKDFGMENNLTIIYHK